tara:strand:+ start:399 stop:827 length:429 start_codon:yes stop_codon:yes gene_type:complete
MAGRKKKLTEKLFDKLLNLIADGLTIREVFSRDDVDFTWQSFRNYLIRDDVLMSRYIKAKELAVDLRLSELEDKRKELEIKIESGELDAKAAQNLVNLYKIIVASSQWSASKLNAKRYGKSAEVLSINSEKNQPLTISWSKP